MGSFFFLGGVSTGMVDRNVTVCERTKSDIEGEMSIAVHHWSSVRRGRRERKKKLVSFCRFATVNFCLFIGKALSNEEKL